ncbi:hypothetical protein COU57_01255 [Candidatus Pacearchaeota archaeon CG10_big_fil_rev_8_21_14_0_10_32_14]|nr:MAG: hypothetical protein COU57_01255 [Candidatus Pacearchaeota archaeon CG10_big_fil_rev_8_21_14_0_10_32_14]
MEESSNLTNFFVWTLSILIVLNLVPYFSSLFSDCKSIRMIGSLMFGRPVCLTQTIYHDFNQDSSQNQNNIQGNIIKDYSDSTSNKEVKKENQFNNLNEEVQFNREIFNLIKSQGKLVSEEYSYCINFIRAKTIKVNEVRDQSTLYQFDGDVKNCLNEYLLRAKTFTQLIQENPKQLTPEFKEKIQSQILTQITNLKLLSNNYIKLSSNRHYYIHQMYQVSSLIDLGKIIGETAGTIASEDPEGTIDSLSSLYDWWYYNGGVIDTGWE